MTREQRLKRDRKERVLAMMNAGYKNLGYANGWTKDNPDEYDNHRCLEHSTGSVQNSYTCDHLYWCDECKIFWMEDSGD